MRDPPPLAKPRTQKHQRTFGFPRGASCCSRHRFAPPLTIVCYAWTPVCIGLMAFKRIWHVTIGLHPRLGSVSDASSLGTLAGGSFGPRFLLRVTRWDGALCNRGL